MAGGRGGMKHLHPPQEGQTKVPGSAGALEVWRGKGAWMWAFVIWNKGEGEGVARWMKKARGRRRQR